MVVVCQCYTNRLQVDNVFLESLVASQNPPRHPMSSTRSVHPLNVLSLSKSPNLLKPLSSPDLLELVRLTFVVVDDDDDALSQLPLVPLSLLFLLTALSHLELLSLLGGTNEDVGERMLNDTGDVGFERGDGMGGGESLSVRDVRDGVCNGEDVGIDGEGDDMMVVPVAVELMGIDAGINEVVSVTERWLVQLLMERTGEVDSPTLTRDEGVYRHALVLYDRFSSTGR
ncbi:hypothetical protein BDY19DRAFT_216594 [Irpex rosettiformis]|uniref:Uncharacterized protein n=1 Tax=Irpex rosettiformis TaxID=378272 RepID=A0ACB8U002_9APHY|nr:hypothetical protein BDY19DRAFT_216594 [Irpex rosettiformis]